MRVRPPNYEIGMQILWMWIGVLGVIVAGYLLTQWWRRSHSSTARKNNLPYSKTLQQRLMDGGTGSSRKATQLVRSKRSP